MMIDRGKNINKGGGEGEREREREERDAGRENKIKCHEMIILTVPSHDNNYDR